MFLEQGIKPENKFWKYIIGFLFVIASVILGRMLIMLVVFLNSLWSNNQLPEDANDSLGYLSPNFTMLLLIIGYIITNFVLFLIVKYIHKQTWQSVISVRPRIDWGRILFSFSVSAVLWICTQIILIYFNPQAQVWIFDPIPFLICSIITFFNVAIRSFAEQCLFRGYLMQGIANWAANRLVPLLIIAVVNALIYSLHPEIRFLGFLEMFLPLLCYTLFLGVLTLMDEGIELSYGFYAASVFITQIFFTSDNTAIRRDTLYMGFETDGDAVNWFVYLPYLIIFPLFLYVCSKKYKWTGWREKLTGKIQHPVNNSI